MQFSVVFINHHFINVIQNVVGYSYHSTNQIRDSLRRLPFPHTLLFVEAHACTEFGVVVLPWGARVYTSILQFFTLLVISLESFKMSSTATIKVKSDAKRRTSIQDKPITEEPLIPASDGDTSGFPLNYAVPRANVATTMDAPDGTVKDKYGYRNRKKTVSWLCYGGCFPPKD